MKINAQVINEEGAYPSLQLHEQLPLEGKISCKVLYSALNHRDLWIVKGQYGQIKYPVILGSDGLLELDGKKYIANPGLEWGDHQAYQGPNFDILGMPSEGCFAERVQVKKSDLYPVPSHLTDQEAAALPLAGLTAYRALFSRAKLEAGEKVFISGVGGGVALFAMQFAISAGAEVYVSSSSKEKIKKAIALGASDGFLYTDEKMHKQVLKSAGPMDVIIDSAGGPGFSKLVNITAKGGRISIYGGTRGKAEFSPQRLFWNQASIYGTTMGSDEDFRKMVHFVSEFKVKPVVDSIYPLTQLDKALERMSKGGQFGKIVISNQE